MGLCLRRPHFTEEDVDVDRLMQAQQLDVSDNYVQMKFILIGDSGSGKTSIFNRLCKSHFTERTITTTSVYFGVVWVEVNGIKFKIYLWDTAGQERYRDLADAYYTDAACFLIIYDMTQERTMTDIKRWMQRIRKNIGDRILDTPKVMIGNKLDLTRDARMNLDPDVIAAAGPDSLQYSEVSAKTGEGVEDLRRLIGEIALETHVARYPESVA